MTNQVEQKTVKLPCDEIVEVENLMRVERRSFSVMAGILLSEALAARKAKNKKA